MCSYWEDVFCSYTSWWLKPRRAGEVESLTGWTAGRESALSQPVHCTLSRRWRTVRCWPSWYPSWTVPPTQTPHLPHCALTDHWCKTEHHLQSTGCTTALLNTPFAMKKIYIYTFILKTLIKCLVCITEMLILLLMPLKNNQCHYAFTCPLQCKRCCNESTVTSLRWVFHLSIDLTLKGSLRLLLAAASLQRWM